MMDVDQSDDPTDGPGKRSREDLEMDPMEAFKRIRIESEAEARAPNSGAASPAPSHALGARTRSLPPAPAPVSVPVPVDEGDVTNRDYERMNSYLGLLEIERAHRRASVG